jgi:hypothetical protein
MSRLRPSMPWFFFAPLPGSGAVVADCGITTAKIADCAVDSTKLADSAVSSAGIADSAITTIKVTDCAITYAKIQNVTALRLLGRWDAVAGVTQEVPLSAELRFDSTNDWMEIADCGILANHLKDSTITYAKVQSVTAKRILGRWDASAGVIQELGVTAPLSLDSTTDGLKILDSGITNGFIADSAISNDKIADCGVRSTELSDSAVTSAKISDASVIASKFYDTSIPVRVIQIHATDTALAVGDTLATFFIPAELNGYDLISAYGAVKVISTGGRPTIQIRNVTDSADMLTNKITLDSGEKTSYTADTAFSIDTSNDCVATGNEIAIDIDSAGTGTEDLYVTLSFVKR